MELIVSVILLSLTVILAMGGMRPMVHSSVTLRDRAAGVTELLLAVESLRQDLGGAATALPAAPDGLHIVREQAVAEALGAWGGGDDDGILYTLVDGDLIREDLELGTTVRVARDLVLFDVTRPVDETSIALRVGEGLSERNTTLVWAR